MSNKNLTPQEHWELHQGLWYMLGCDMELKHINNNTVVYVDKITNKQCIISFSILSSIFPITL